MVVLPPFTYFFTLREGIEAKLLCPKKFAPKLRKSCKQNYLKEEKTYWNV